jgi:hypothetical protein
MPSIESETGDIILSLPPLAYVENDPETGYTIFSPELPVTISVDETVVEISAEGIEMEAPDISLTAEAAVEVEAGADFDLTVGGAVEVESSDISITALAVEVEAALFTVA